MDEAIKSSLVRGKPAWRVRYMRFFWVQMVCGILAMGIVYQLDRYGFNVALLVFFVIYMIGQAMWWIALVTWLRKFGVKFFSFTKMLLQVQGVPCPNCLYPICEPQDAPGVKLCPECGCSVDGAEAMKAWKRVPKLKIPAQWDGV